MPEYQPERVDEDRLFRDLFDMEPEAEEELNFDEEQAA